ncbi:unnamed protein product [Pocillopora meandrina]|uniref:Uncharacterized protein n=1 Tax=Pocillopora meandrina TaxID=46732 RepID=A0AAU9W4L2_9CNID|nr:unnamed protein product [Pocillopora meandrina]
MAFQIANLRHPNSKTNTVVFAMFHAKDSWANLKTALMKYKEQVNTLKEATWAGKKKVVFLFGDYEFLCKLFGIAGASGKYPCLWCKINHEVMQVSCHKHRHAEKRSLENIQEDYDKFVADGSVTSRQKFYHNVIHEKLLDIELDKVCVPGLHISLGVFKKLFDELENQCFELDKKIQMVLAGDSEENDEKIQAFRAAQLHTRQAQQFNEKTNYLQELLNLQSLHTNEKLADEQMELAAFEKANGPLSVHLDEVLKKMNVERQAYHGKSFIGNHVHTCCKVTQILPLDAVLTKTEELCPSLLSQAREISVKFEQVFKLFAACHFVYDSADYLNDGKIDKLEEDITNFLQFLREKFPDMTVTPKLHMLEEHVCPFLRQWHMGLGFYGEQGIEGIHSEFNTQSQHFDHVKKKDTRLRQILVNHHIATSPELAGKAPKPKERILKRKANE